MDILVLASTCLVLMFLLGIMVGAAWSSYRIHKGLNPPPLSTQPSNLTIQPGDFGARLSKLLAQFLYRAVAVGDLLFKVSDFGGQHCNLLLAGQGLLHSSYRAKLLRDFAALAVP